MSSRPSTKSLLRVAALLLTIGFAEFSLADQRSVGGGNKAPALGIDSIYPTSAPEGRRVAIKGSNLDDATRITIAGTPAEILAKRERQLKFRVPRGIAVGTTEVVVFDRRGHSASIELQVLPPVIACDNDRLRAWERDIFGFANNSRSDLVHCIAPPAARKGEPVTLLGDGLNSVNLKVTVGGVPAVIVARHGVGVKFIVPDAAVAGATEVSVSSANGRRTDSIGFTVLDGVTLPGSPSGPAISALSEKRAAPVDSSLIENGVILTQLEVSFAPNATIGDINSALELVQGGIVSMSQGIGFVTIAVPAQETAIALLQLANTLSTASGIASAFPAREAVSDVLPPVPSFLNHELLPVGFPAAWNAMNLATKGCESRKVPILVADHFASTLPNSHVGFSGEIPNFTLVSSGQSSSTHGYDVTTTIGAAFNEHSPTGANPFSQCLDVIGVDTEGMGSGTAVDAIVDNFPAPPFILNYSQAFNGMCDVEVDANGNRRCTVDSVKTDVPTAIQRAQVGEYWRLKTNASWNQFLLTASAGNTREPVGNDPDYLVASAYPGAGEAEFNSALTVGAASNSLFTFAQDSSLWKPVGQPDYPDLTATSPQIAQLDLDVVLHGLDKVGKASNTLIVGSTQQGDDPTALIPSKFSGLGSDLSAVGESVLTFSGFEDGTSFAAPQLAGLASYLWLLSPDLRAKPSSVTHDAIFANTRGSNVNVIDAYATVLSLDAATLPTPSSAPVRLAILDVNNDGKFDENDVSMFLDHLLDADGNAVQPTQRDYSRFDLNGDGFTGGDATDHFDLDRIQSTQYGATIYSTDVTQEIEGKTVHFNSSAVNDLQVLCYYAYSPTMFTGDPAIRSKLLNACAGVSVTVDPESATLKIGGTQQFAAKVVGNNDVRVAWSLNGVPGGNANLGTIDANGLFTAKSGGIFTVRATSVADTRAFGEATVTVNGGCGLIDTVDYLHYEIGNRGGDPNPLDSEYQSGVNELSNSASSPKASDSVDVRYGNIQVAASDADTGNVPHGQPAFAFGEFEDDVSITAVDPAKQGTLGTVTISMRVTATPQVSGDRAIAIWSLNSGFPFRIFPGASGTLSTVAGGSSGDLNGGTYSATAPFFIGAPGDINSETTFYEFLDVTVGPTCAPNETCPPPGLTGSGSIQAKLQWLGVTAKDANGNPLAISVCSQSGTNWLHPQ